MDPVIFVIWDAVIYSFWFEFPERNAKNLQDFLEAFLRELATCVVEKLICGQYGKHVEVLEPND